MEKLWKLCCWRAEQNVTVNSSSSKFVQGSKNYQLQNHDVAKPYAATKTAKEDCDTRKAGLFNNYHPAVLLPNPCSRLTIKIGKLSPHFMMRGITLHYTEFSSHNLNIIYIWKNYTMSLTLARMKMKHVKISF